MWAGVRSADFWKVVVYLPNNPFALFLGLELINSELLRLGSMTCKGLSMRSWSSNIFITLSYGNHWLPALSLVVVSIMPQTWVYLGPSHFLSSADIMVLADLGFFFSLFSPVESGAGSSSSGLPVGGVSVLVTQFSLDTCLSSTHYCTSLYLKTHSLLFVHVVLIRLTGS